MSTIICPLAAQAQRFPAGSAIWQEDRKISFDELDQRVTALKAYWQQAGMRPGNVVLFCPTGKWYDLALLYSLWRVAAVVCPLSPRLPSSQGERTSALLLADWILDAPTVCQTVEQLGMAARTAEERMDCGQPATIVLTSGSSGTPQAVVHSLAAHLASARGSQANIPLTADDRWLLSLPIWHVGGLAIPIRCLLAGAAVVIDPGRRPLAEQLSRNRVTHASVVSTQLRRLLMTPFHAPPWKAVLLGGSSYPPALVHDSLQRGVPLVTSYGLTEMASQVTATRPHSEPRELMTAGHVLPGRQLAVAADGEILVRGDTLCLGYRRQGAMIPATDEAGWFHTGDVGWLDAEHLLHVTGRRDQMFISGGENIHPEEIEVALLSVPGVLRAVVVPVTDPDFGCRPLAFVEAADFDPPRWIRALRERLPGFKVPRNFRPWPADVPTDVKPSRAWLRSLAEN